MAVGRVIPIFRAAVLGLTSLFLIIVLGLSAHLITISTGPHGYGVVRDVEGLGVAVAVLSFVTVIPFLVLSLFTRGSFFNWNVVELPVLGFILILWLAESAIATQWTSVLYPGGCSGIRYNLDQSYCNELYAIEGLSFVVWLSLLAYIITNIVFSILGRQRGNKVWKISANDATYLEHNNKVPPVDGGVPMQQQQPQFTGQQAQYSHTAAPPPAQQQPQYAQPGPTYSPVQQQQYQPQGAQV